MEPAAFEVKPEPRIAGTELVFEFFSDVAGLALQLEITFRLFGRYMFLPG
jgi:hypothetical protein